MASLLLVLLLSANELPGKSRQMIVVVTPDAEATSGRLYRFERNRDNGKAEDWRPVGEVLDVVVGERGLAAGTGLHRGILPGIPVKAEGDGRSPAGIFALTQVFGLAEEPPGLRMPYLQLVEPIECVDDPESRDYGRITRRGVAAAWTSSERMWEIPDYAWGVVVGHNPARRPSAGSCIFLHTWAGAGPPRPTAGCTAMETSAMKDIVDWLDDDREPVLVQLTESLYSGLSVAWKLPEAVLDSATP